VVAATNEPLEMKVKDGSFREDLYYRLNVIPIPLPSLRERIDDVPLLVAHFLKDKVNPHTGKPYQITRQTMEVLCAYDWPGNVRELENAIERAATLCEGNILQVADLPPALLKNLSKEEIAVSSGEFSAATVTLPEVPATALYPLDNEHDTTFLAAPESPAAQPGVPLKTFLREQELAFLNRTLAQTGGDKEKAATLLGVSLATLYRKLSEDATEP
jgi:DNA-binding NtrC family response regulator